MTKARKTLLTFAVLVPAAGLALAAYHLYSPRRTPSGQPPLVKLTSDNLHELRESFNASVDETRVLAMLSPT